MPQTNGAGIATGDAGAWGTAAARKKPTRTGPWPTNKAEAISALSTTTRPQSILAANGTSAASSMSSIHQANGVVPSQQMMQTTGAQNAARQGAAPGESNPPMLYLLSLNGTFERKTIAVPIYPDVLRIGRQTNAKTVPTPTNGYFDSKVLSRSHAEIWAERDGKIWIRDVRSSNGTFVNGARLSAENRDSEPNLLQSGDHLELGIDIVSEDQKTVVHHKVAAKVEHAGFLGPTNNVLDMNFGDLDPANGTMMMPTQNGLQLRGRTSSQGSIGSNGRVGPPGSIAASNLSMAQNRPMNFWLTPITTEQIVKRLTVCVLGLSCSRTDPAQQEMRAAKLQNQDLIRTEQFVSTLISGKDVKEIEKPALPEPPKPASLNGSLSFKIDGKPRFSDPPAPPPQQPLPEKPDVARHAHEPVSPTLLRTNTERPRSVAGASPVRQNPDPQMSTLIEALNQAKKEIDAQNSKVKNLEEMLQKEREARELAEDVAKKLELESGSRMNGSAVSAGSSSQDSREVTHDAPEVITESPTAIEEITAKAVEESTSKLQARLDTMLVEMNEMKQHMESYRQRAEFAEKERDADRKTLAEMVLRIRADDSGRRSSSTERARSPAKALSSIAPPSEALKMLDPEFDDTADVNCNITAIPPQLVAALRPPGSQDQLLYHSGPYASMLGVVLIGMGIMAYMNGWQKTER